MHSLEAVNMPYKLLKDITDDFSYERILGRGTFGVVYKGVDKDGNEIAVKLLNSVQGVDDKEFLREFNNLNKLKHHNIVQFVGFCNEAEEVPTEHEGKHIIALKMHRALCFEYMHNGSLKKHLYDEHQGFGWQKRYNIIKGICEGLKHLHMGLEGPVYHLDLKPDNILLDTNMVPKIADFGLSRLLGEENTKKTINPVGTLGYCPPEFINYQIISTKFDIFSLGVIIIKIMCGTAGYSHINDMRPAKFIKRVHNKWKERLRTIVGSTSLERDCQQVKKCVEIALKCVNKEKERRPNIGYIVDQLSEMEEVGSMKCSSQGKSLQTQQILTSILPKELQANFLKQITNDFSPENILGHSFFGTVYKGILPEGGVIAVKKLTEDLVGQGEAFNAEVTNLMALQHDNIVKLVGFCQNTQERAVQDSGRYVLVKMVESFVCYQYLPEGSLDMYLQDKWIDWNTRFKIIQGICEGVHFLHKGLDRPLIHLNLVPNSIWLDDNLVPKIADFGLSRLFCEEQTRMNTINVIGQRGYMAPEYLYRGEISSMSDIYSLGILIIEIATGEKNCLNFGDITTRNFVEKVRQNWEEDAKIASNFPSLDANSLNQIKTCIEVGLTCVDVDRMNRPSIETIVRMLNMEHVDLGGKMIRSIVEKENMLNGTSEIRPTSTELLDVYPAQLCFALRPDKLFSCPLLLINTTDYHVVVRLRTKNKKRYTKMPLRGVVPPLSTYTLVVTMEEQKKLRSLDSDEFLTLESSIVREGGLSLKNADLDLAAILFSNFFNKAKATAAGKVHELTLKVVSDTQEEATFDRRPLESEIETISDGNISQVLSVDVHPTEPWIMTSHHGGDIHIWDYQAQEIEDSFDLSKKPVYSAKFIERRQWLVAGDGDGTIYAYSYDDDEVVTTIEAHEGDITSLAVHPTDPFVLSSSDDHRIKLWDWEQGWKCTRTFQGHSNRVTQVNFNPMDTNTFASASLDHTIRIWSISSNESKMTLRHRRDGLLCVHNYTSDIRQCLITGSWDGTAQIWDLEKKRCVQTLKGHVSRLSSVFHHPGLPIVTTGSYDGTVRMWNSTTYRLENIIGINLGAVYAFGYIEGSKRLVVGCHQGMAIIDTKSPVASLLRAKYDRDKIKKKTNRVQAFISKVLGA